MTKRKLLPWIITIVLVACLAIVLLLYCFAKSDNSVLDAKNSSNIGALNSRIAALERESSSSSSVTGAIDAQKLDIALAAEQTALMTSQNIKTSTLEDETTYTVPPSGKYVYLTFDDGPSANTPGVLDILKKNDVKATFFVIYNQNKDYYKQIVAGGHTLALHTYTHDYKQVYKSVDAYFSDLEKISDYVKGITGVQSKIVRLPGGGSNTISRNYKVGVMTEVAQELQKRGYTYYDWNAQCMDATTANISPAQILTNVKSFSESNGVKKPFVMILLHNGSFETTTEQALQSVIDYYRAGNYKFMQVTADTPAVHQPVQN